jgi:hypothetical protein
MGIECRLLGAEASELAPNRRNLGGLDLLHDVQWGLIGGLHT